MWRKIVLNTLYYTGAESLLTPVLGGIGSILMLHRVQNVALTPFSPNYHLSASPEFLDEVILDLKTGGYEFISLDEVAMRLENPAQYKNAKPFICITLDDGYKDNTTNAVPIFRRHNVPYAIYVSPGLTEGKSTLWWEDVEHVIAKQKKITVDLPDGRQEFDVSTNEKKNTIYFQLVKRLLLDTDQVLQREIVTKLCKAYGFDAKAHVLENIMNWEEIKALAKDPLCTIGAHTMNHYALSKIDKDYARSEMQESREVIKSILGKDPIHFAYPYGMKDVAGKREFEIATELGFRTAATTRHGVLYNEHQDHMTALPRVSLNGHHQSKRYVKTLLSGVPTRLKNKSSKVDIA
jgi:peptidoglycan/xylan/chitin deacetylase (PgdA/CDA1 family)